MYDVFLFYFLQIDFFNLSDVLSRFFFDSFYGNFYILNMKECSGTVRYLLAFP